MRSRTVSPHWRAPHIGVGVTAAMTNGCHARRLPCMTKHVGPNGRKQAMMSHGENHPGRFSPCGNFGVGFGTAETEPVLNRRAMSEPVERRRCMMDDVFDHDGPFGDLLPGGRPSRSRKELEAENERLKENLLRSREENDLLAELITGQFEEGSGEVMEGEREDHAEGRSQFVISDAAIDLFETLPEMFTLDEALDRAEQMGQPSAETARHLHAYLGERMVVQENERFAKTGRKPYF